jgi:antitoxin YefM
VKTFSSNSLITNEWTPLKTANPRRRVNEAVDAGAPIVVTRQGGKGNVVMISEAEFAGWQETVHLLSSPANAARLLASMSAADAGALPAHDVLDPSERA